MKLQGKTAIITGAAKGIGAAAARRFAAEGARIVLADKDEANGHEVAKAIVKEGGEAAFCLCDVGNEADVQAALDTAARTYGKLDIVVNNAGWQLNKTLLETTAEEFNAVLNTNLTSMFLFTKGAANMFIAQKTGGPSSTSARPSRWWDLRDTSPTMLPRAGWPRLRGRRRFP